MKNKTNQERAKEIFAGYASKDTVYFASDGQAFFDENMLNNHVKTLKDKETDTVIRATFPEVAAETEEDADTVFISEQQREQARIALETEFEKVVGVTVDEHQTDQELKDAIAESEKAKAAAESEKLKAEAKKGKAKN